jgi:glycosyltransferase involved in cell wall biosynthesis
MESHAYWFLNQSDNLLDLKGESPVQALRNAQIGLDPSKITHNCRSRESSRASDNHRPVTIALLSQWDGSWLREETRLLNELGYRVYYDHVCHSGWFGPLRYIFFFVTAFPHVLLSDVVFCWFVYPAGLVAVLLAKICRRPVIVNAVGYDVSWMPNIGYGMAQGPHRQLIKCVLRSATTVLAISRFIADLAKSLGARDPLVIYEAIDTTKFQPRSEVEKPKHVRSILTVSTLSPMNIRRKDLGTLLKAVQLARLALPNLRLTIVGYRGTEAAYLTLRHMIRDLRIDENVIFRTDISDEELIDEYCKCELFVSSSLHEGFPTVVTEALACGAPVLAAAAQVMPEVIRNRYNGVIVLGGDPIELATALQELLMNQSLRFEIARRARSSVTNFTREERRARVGRVVEGLVH